MRKIVFVLSALLCFFAGYVMSSFSARDDEEALSNYRQNIRYLLTSHKENNEWVTEHYVSVDGGKTWLLQNKSADQK